jgi:hypothetical protein
MALKITPGNTADSAVLDEIADSDEASHRFRRKPATCSD